jgi:catechol 2,3-dioxygenase-like lactoylglutathione lyase family enzyme
MLESVQPVLMSSDLTASIRFYERLGFVTVFQDSPSDPRYAGIRRDGVELHLQWHGEEQWSFPADRPTYRFVVREVDAFYAELRERGALESQRASRGPWREPADTPWGTREFHILDPDGNGLQFYAVKIKP